MAIDISNICAVPVVGGVGKRLRPFTNEKPKAMLPIGLEKKPMLEFTINPWIKFGIKKYVFCTGYKSEMIEEYFGDGHRFGVDIQYSREKDNLETGGALKNMIDNKKITTDQPIIVFYCDDIIRLNVKDFIEKHIKGVKEFGFKATVVATSKFRVNYGIMNVETLDKGIKKVTSFEEKPLIERYANVGVYFLEPEVLELINKCQPPFKFEKIILPELVKREWLMLHEISHDDWIPVNTDKEYEDVIKTNLTDFYSRVLKRATS
ncbi:MAG: nucleotidyltransferase family protein [Candidatus Aenigmarchaeota archaeon]|nr:nucleotidyltransferase family protein [Candidatus Aenigmarchaeota archaeon]